MRTSALLSAVLPLALLAGCGDDTEAEAAAPESVIAVADGWVRATVGTEDPSMTGAFMQISNEGSTQATLVGASSPVAGVTEIHEMSMQDGAMVMREVEGGLEIEAGKLIVLQPGGNHLMLMDMQEELAPGDEVELTLEFADGSTEQLTVPVKAFTEEEGHYHEPPADGADDE